MHTYSITRHYPALTSIATFIPRDSLIRLVRRACICCFTNCVVQVSIATGHGLSHEVQSGIPENNMVLALEKPSERNVVVTVDSKVFSIPREYLGSISAQSQYFDFYFYWPSKCPIKQIDCNVTNGAEDLIAVLVRPNRQAKDGYSGLHEMLKYGNLVGPMDTGQPPGLVLYTDSGTQYGRNIYVATNSKTVTPSGNNLLFVCNKNRFWIDKPYSECSEQYKYSDGVSVIVRFYTKYLHDWDEIHKAVNDFLDRFAGLDNDRLHRAAPPDKRRRTTSPFLQDK